MSVAAERSALSAELAALRTEVKEAAGAHASKVQDLQRRQDAELAKVEERVRSALLQKDDTIQKLHAQWAKSLRGAAEQPSSVASYCPVSSFGSTRISDFEPTIVAPLPAGGGAVGILDVGRSEQCPAAKVIAHAEATGPASGWSDGWLTSMHGFLEPSPGASMAALRHTDSGAVWVGLAMQLPTFVDSLAIRLSLQSRLPVLPADEAAVPPAALVAADTVLSRMAHAFSWEWRRANPEGKWTLDLLPAGVSGRGGRPAAGCSTPCLPPCRAFHSPNPPPFSRTSGCICPMLGSPLRR